MSAFIMNSVFNRIVLSKVARSFSQGRVVASKNKDTMGTTLTKFYSPKDAACDNACSAAAPCSTTGTITPIDTNELYVEKVVCNEKSMKNNEMQVFEITTEGRVLVVKQKDQFMAVGTKCTHYGAPLVNGALGDGRIRCPWHGACFNLKTGDIEDFPGFDSLPCYQVTVAENGDVKVRAKLSDLKSNKRIKEVSATCVSSSIMQLGAVIIGGGPSGATCAETLRSEGYKGIITIISKEPYLPYDRIKVSKLSTITPIEKLEARTREYYKNADITVLTGVEATKVDTEGKQVHMSNGDKIGYTSLFIATGSKARVPDSIKGVTVGNVFTMRDYDDNVNILKTLGEKKDKDVVVLGLSFIGLEAAAAFVEKAKSMTVVGTDSAPLGRVFGKEIGLRLKKLFEEKGVKFRLNETITQCTGQMGLLKSVKLGNSETLPADVLILGVGTTYYTDFLADSGIEMLDGAVVVNDRLETNVKNVYAGGDIAYAPVFAAENKHINIGHIGLAQFHGRVAALNMLKKDHKLKTVPYFWTTVFGKSIRYSGCGKPASNMIVGDIQEMKFVMFFFDENEKVIAVASCMRDPVVSQFAEFTHQGKKLHKKDLQEDPFSWPALIN